MCKIAAESPLSLPYQDAEQNLNFDSLTDDEKINVVARRILERNREAFLELASGRLRCD